MHSQSWRAIFKQNYPTLRFFILLCILCAHCSDLAHIQEVKRMPFLSSYRVSPSSFSPSLFSSSHFLLPFYFPPLHCVFIMINSGAVGRFKVVAPPCFNNCPECSFLCKGTYLKSYRLLRLCHELCYSASQAVLWQRTSFCWFNFSQI